MTRRSRPTTTVRRGFTIIEASVSVIIVSVMLVAALQTVSQAALLQHRIGQRARAKELARAMMTEILQQAYVEPGASPTFGPEPGEVRSGFDDVDDYNGLVEASPTSKDGTGLTVNRGATWSRSVTVVWANPVTLATASPQVETGAKKITVTVFSGGSQIESLVAIRTNPN
ncbi:MAG: type II secretion system protein [Tepidisphaeraceae bacterium]